MSFSRLNPVITSKTIAIVCRKGKTFVHQRAISIDRKHLLYLQIGDMDAGRMLVHVRRGKEHKDRLVPLVSKTLDLLRAHWATHRNPRWLFPREGSNHQQAPTAQESMASTTVQVMQSLERCRTGNTEQPLG